MTTLPTRRDFIAAATGTLVAVATLDTTANALSPPPPTGPVVGLTGPHGLAPGTASSPSVGLVTLLDGRTLDVRHATSWRIGPHKSVLIAPEPDGSWSVLYAEC